MKFLYFIILLLILSSCCKPSGISTREEINYIYKDSIRYSTKADTFKVFDTVPYVNFIPYVASTFKVVPRTVRHSDGTFKDKFDSLYLEYSLLDSIFKFELNSSPDTVFKQIQTEVFETMSFWGRLQIFAGGIFAGALISFVLMFVIGRKF